MSEKEITENELIKEELAKEELIKEELIEELIKEEIGKKDPTEEIAIKEIAKKENTEKEITDVEALVALLDGCTRAGESRIKIDVVDGEGEVVSRRYHHGRCDVGSPWACGTAFDVLE